MSYKDKLKAISTDRATEINQESMPTHRVVKIEAREKHVQMNVKLPEDLIDRLDQEIVRRYPAGQRTRKQALTEALEAWLKTNSSNSA